MCATEQKSANVEPTPRKIPPGLHPTTARIKTFPDLIERSKQIIRIAKNIVNVSEKKLKNMKCEIKRTSSHECMRLWVEPKNNTEYLMSSSSESSELSEDSNPATSFTMTPNKGFFFA